MELIMRWWRRQKQTQKQICTLFKGGFITPGLIVFLAFLVNNHQMHGVHLIEDVRQPDSNMFDVLRYRKEGLAEENLDFV